MSDKTHCCIQLRENIANAVINYDLRFDEFGIVLRSDPDVQTLQKIDFCPWCGARLPESWREKWFDQLEASGVDPMNDAIPKSYQSDEWRKGLTD